jgi:carboxyl-terminal processing protease
MLRRRVSLTALICLLIISAVAASTLTMALTGGERAQRASVASGTPSRYARLDEILEIVRREYYTDVDEDALVLGAIRGMLAELEDPYTFYYTPEEFAAMDEESSGLYQGVGMLIGLDGAGGVTVLRVFRNSPAERAGVLAGDQIASVEGVDIGGESAKGLAEAVSLLRGEGGSDVRVGILRGGERIDIVLSRDAVSINYVEYSILDGDIGYLSIYQFTGDDVSGVQEAVDAFQNAGVSGLIVDVRSNPGGLLKDVVGIADMFLPQGVIVYTEDRQGRRQEFYADAEYWDVPMVVLVDGMSASASEIFAAAVQDAGRGAVVGETTYGKGVVQTLMPFPEGDGVQLTTSAYYTASGRSIHGVGVEPDVVAALDGGELVLYHEPDPERDSQLSKAIEVLRERIG